MYLGMFLIVQAIPTYAKVPSSMIQTSNYVPIAPLWDNVSGLTVDLSSSNGKAVCFGRVNALSGTTSIKATFTLERKNGSTWTHEKSWSQESTTSLLTFSDSNHSITAGNTYRLTLTAVVTRNGKAETVSTSTESKL